VPHGLRDATTEPANIKRWWATKSAANIGIRTGSPSGIVVLDVDPRHGGDESLGILQRRNEKLPDTVVALTGGGGSHWLFAHPGGGVLIRNVTGLGGLPGLDVRGDGGYIVAPPSTHRSGRSYEWELSSHPDERPLAPCPPWFLELLAGGPTRSTAPPRRTPAWWRNLVAQGAEEGHRNQTVAALAGHLLRRAVDPFVTLHLITAWNAAVNRPPLSADEIARTVNSIAGAELRRRQRGRSRG